MSSNLPSGTVTFLFTDIEGSTRLWERHPETMRAALARYDAILCDAVEAYHGHVVKTTGDGCHAVFATALDGILATLTAQRAFGAEQWAEIAPDTLRVRMALHTGEAEARAGDYFGPALNRAARLMVIGHGGQILLSTTAADLVRDQLPGGAALHDLGEHRLKDMIRPERVFQLNAPGLPADFPSLKSLDVFPHNLPIQLTSFVGREKEIGEVKQLISVHRLMTLTGPGGTGKTRLALQTAAELLDQFADGVWLVELAPLADPALVTTALAAALGVRELQGQPLLDTLTDYLRFKQLLLILDNCEHLVEACARLVEHLLRACPQLKILASSREALGIAGEAAYRVPSLSLPESPSAALPALAQCEAARLFLERAQAALPNFVLTERNAPAIAQICRRLDGIPLAIELAAARVKLLQAEQIAARLDDRFRLLTGGSRTALPRQQTLRALIDWSWELLSEPERVLLRRLSVFAGGWTLEAAEAVCGAPPSPLPLSLQGIGVGGEGPLDILDLLAQLVNKSLVVVEREQGDEARYRLLETIRQYAREKLLESGEAVHVRDRHLDYFLQFAEEADPKLLGPDMVVWLDQLELEKDNLRTAVEWSLESQPAKAMRLASTLSGGFRRNRASEAVGWLKAALARAEALPPAEGEAVRAYQAIRAKALASLAGAYFGIGDSPTALTTANESIPLARQINDSYTLAVALGIGGLAAALIGDVETARAFSEEAVALCREKGYVVEEGLALAPLGAMAIFVTGDFAKARAINAEAVRLARQSGNPWLKAMSALNLARLASITGDLPEARARFEECTVLFGQIHDRHFMNVCRSELGHAFRWHGAYEKALALYREAIGEWRELGNRAAAAHELECFAFIAEAQSQPERAAKLLGAAEALREACGSPMTPMERGEYDQAVPRLRAQMDESAFAKTWAAGRTLEMGPAIEFTLEA